MQRHEILHAYSPFYRPSSGPNFRWIALQTTDNGVMTVCFFGCNDHLPPPCLSVKGTFTRDFALVPKDAHQAKMP